MGTLYENLTDLCNERGISGNQMCVEAGVARNIMTELSKGRRTGLTNKTLEKLAAYFNVSVDTILTGKKEKPTTEDGDELDFSETLKNVTHEEAALYAVEFAKKLSYSGKVDLLRQLAMMLDDDK